MRETSAKAVASPPYATVAGAVDGLTERGFVEHFRIEDGYLHGLESGEMVRASDVIIREYYRFEGVSDPDDMAIVYAVETPDGVRGTLTDAFGVYSDPGMSAALGGALLCPAGSQSCRVV
jgi:hypothetical protein